MQFNNERIRRAMKSVPKLSKRFSLRVLLLVVTAVSALLGWHMHHVRLQRAAVSHLEAGGVVVEYGAPHYGFAPRWAVEWLGRDHFASPVSVNFSATQVDFTDRACLADLASQLSCLRLHSFEIVDAHYLVEEQDIRMLLAGLSSAKRVKLDGIHYSNLTREALVPLTELPDLAELELRWHSHLAPEGPALDLFAQMQSLKSLQLPWETRDEAIRMLQQLPELRVTFFDGPDWQTMPPVGSSIERKYWRVFQEMAASNSQR